MKDKKILVDLRSFGAIGFQDAPNGLWLRRQGYKQSDLLRTIAESCIKNQCGLMAITSEDDKMRPEYPEDRFGFLAKQIPSLPREYFAERKGNLIKVVRSLDMEETIYLINSETIHAPSGENWAGIKVQVIGRNNIPKNYSLPELFNYCREKGLISLICNSGQSMASEAITKIHAENATGIITHDSNNSFHPLIGKIPLLRNKLNNYLRDKNEIAKNLAESLKVAGVAVSSSHYMHQIGSSGILVNEYDNLGISGGNLLNFKDEENLLESLRKVISSRRFENKIDYNSQLDVLNLGYLLARYGSAQNRFEGTLSSYNS